MKILPLSFVAMLGALMLPGCQRQQSASDSPAAAPSPTPSATSTTTPSMNNDAAVIHTTEGDMTFQFWPDAAPNTVANFEKLAKQGFYNGTAFHRIIKGFMIQGGDPLTKDPAQEARWGTGGPGYSINAEFNSHHHERGVLSMARSQDPNSAGSQFFVCLGDAGFLDGKYTAFGKLIKGDDVLGKIGDTQVTLGSSGESSKPLKRIEIKSIDIVPLDSVK